MHQINSLIPANLLINITVLPSTLQATGLTAVIISNQFYNLSLYDVRYLVVDGGFNKLVILYHISAHPSGGVYNLTSASPFISNVMVPSINTTGTLRCFLVWNGLNITLIPPGIFHIQTSATLNFTDLQITITTKYSSPIGFMGMVFAAICYSEQVVA